LRHSGIGDGADLVGGLAEHCVSPCDPPGITSSVAGEPGMNTVDAAIPMNPGHGHSPARRRVARLISAPSDAMLCKKQSQLA
jgi:hypothetical protein